MKTRDYKSFSQGECYHLYNRGTGKIRIFETPEDYDFFLARLGEYLRPDERRRAPSASSAGRYERKAFAPGAFSVVCFCLMPNHYHLVVRQNTDVSISDLMLRLITGYSKYFNKKHERVGSLFQDQFKAVRVESNEQLLWLSAYVHHNAKLAGLVQESEEYLHSSYAQYVRAEPGLCDTGLVVEQFSDCTRYREFVEEAFESLKENKTARAEGALLQ